MSCAPPNSGFLAATLLVLPLLLIGCSQPTQQPSAVAATKKETPAQTPAVTAATPVSPAVHPGKAVYDRACAACHNNPETTRAPALEALQKMRMTNITYALTEGKMQLQAAGLTNDEKIAVASYLAGPAKPTDDWIANMMCPADRAKVNLSQPASVLGFGFDKKNHRHLTKVQAGLATADFGRLELAWALAFPQATTMRSQPAIVGSTLFFPVAETSRLYAIDVSQPQPCLQWVYNAGVQLRTSAAFGELKNGRKVIAFGDAAANIHLLDAATGAKLWQTSVQLYSLSLTTGTPIIHDGRVYAPISQYEITVGGNDNHECCKTHGAVVALDGDTGQKIWTAHSMEEAKPVRDRGDGRMIWGPSGAPIWNSPAIDAKRGLLFVGTGEATSEPAAKTTDAILAIDLKDGSIKWSFQATENDIFLTGCLRGKGLNCAKVTVQRDVDFGASVIVGQKADGKDVLFAGQKAGTLWALDPDTGKLVWRQDFGDGSPLGGIHWGIAFDGERVFAPINRPYGMAPAAPGVPRTQKPGIHAVNATTGAVVWTYAAEPDCSGDRQTRVRGCSNNIGFSGAPTVVDGALIAGSLDGFLRVFDAKTGAVLYQFDTAQKFAAINGVPGTGGSVDNASIVAANGQLFVASGYGMFGQPPGNVLLAFRPKTR